MSQMSQMSQNQKKIRQSDDWIYTRMCVNERDFKTIHLKQCILYRKFIKTIIITLGLPEKEIEKTILSYVGTSRFPMYLDNKKNNIIRSIKRNKNKSNK